MYGTDDYYVEVAGKVDEATFNEFSPIAVRVRWTDSETSRLAIQTDQSGLIGLLRHLHQQGYVLLSASRDSRRAEREAEDECRAR